MSSLEVFLQRLIAQLSCLETAARLVADVAGPVLELGLGNGRTYDHLRTILPGRDIWAFDRSLAAHPASIRPEDRMILGDLRATLPSARARIGAPAAFVHVDLGGNDGTATAQAVAPLIAPLMAAGGVIVSVDRLALDGWREAPPPDPAAEGRCFLYRRGLP